MTKHNRLAIIKGPPLRFTGRIIDPHLLIERMSHCKKHVQDRRYSYEHLWNTKSAQFNLITEIISLKQKAAEIIVY